MSSEGALVFKTVQGIGVGILRGIVIRLCIAIVAVTVIMLVLVLVTHTLVPEVCVF